MGPVPCAAPRGGSATGSQEPGVPPELGKSTNVPSVTHLPCAVNSEIKPSMSWDNFSRGLRGSRAGLDLRRTPPGGSHSPYLALEAEDAEAEGGVRKRPRPRRGGRQLRRSRAADARGDPATQGAHGSPGSLSCAPLVQDDSASAGSVVTVSRREGSTKLLVTPQTSFTSPFLCGLPQCAPASG